MHIKIRGGQRSIRILTVMQLAVLKINFECEDALDEVMNHNFEIISHMHIM